MMKATASQLHNFTFLSLYFGHLARQPLFLNTQHLEMPHVLPDIC
jgi:hypothetical protein